MIGMLIDTSKEGGKTLSGSFMMAGGAISIAGAAVTAFSKGLEAIPWMAVVSGIFAVINGFSTLTVTSEERLEEL